MREDIDLERNLLLYLEDNDKSNGGFLKYQFNDYIVNSGYSEMYVLKHCDLLKQRGLINFTAQSGGNNIYYIYSVGPLTAKGYDFIASTRNNDIWEKIKDKLADKGLDKTLAIVLEYLPIIVKSLVG